MKYLFILLLCLPYLSRAAESLPRVVPTLADLIALDPIPSKPKVEVLGYYSVGDGGGGIYTLTNTITGTNAYGGRLMSKKAGWSWELENDGTRVLVTQFGAMPNDGIIDSDRMDAALDYAKTIPLLFPLGDYDTDRTFVIQPNTAAGIGISGHKIVGVSWNGTAAVTNALSFQHSKFIAHHTNPIIQYAGSGGGIENFDFAYADWAVSSNTTAHCIKFAGNNTVMSEFKNLRFYNGYRSFFAENDGYQVFSCIFENIFILGFYNSAFELQQPGTQSIFRNIYITPKAPILASPINSETTSSISTVSKTSTFTLAADHAAIYDVGELVTVSGCNNTALNGNHTIVAVSGTSISIEWETIPSPLPTIATISRNGGSAVIDGYIIRCSQYREDEWINLNVEWVRCANGQGLLFGDRTTIVGLHLEGIGFGSDSFSSGIWVRSYGSLTVVGWDLFNSYVTAGQTWYVFGPGTSDARVTVFGGRARDQYYNAGATLGICGTTGGIPDDSLYFDSYTTWNTSRWNRTGTFNGVNYAKKLVGSEESTGKVTIGNTSAGNTLYVKGGASGVRMMQLERSGFDIIGLSPTTDGILFYNETEGKQIGQWVNDATSVTMRFGSGYSGANAPSVLLEGTGLTTTADGGGGNFTITAPRGTGNSTVGGDIQFGTPNAGTSGTSTQSYSTKVKIKREGQIKFVTRSSAPTVNVEDGDVYYDTTLNKLRVRAAGAWVDLH